MYATYYFFIRDYLRGLHQDENNYSYYLNRVHRTSF